MPDLSNELTRINQEIYKKSAELVEHNKVLTLLHNIDQITLESITDVSDVAHKVATVTTDKAELRGMAIMLIDKDKKKLDLLTVSQAAEITGAGFSLGDYLTSVSLIDDNNDNILAKAVRDNNVKHIHSLSALSVSVMALDTEQRNKLDELIKMISIFPFIVRGEILGLMILFLGQKVDEISEFKKEFLEQLPNIIGVALDNSLLFKATQEANEKLKQLDKLKDDFVSLASHELRTPMTVIRSYLWMAVQGKAGELNPKQKFYLDRAYSSTVRLINLVNEMLNISRIESGRMSVDIKKCDIVTLVNEICFELKVRAQELGIALKVAPAHVPQVLADADKIKEVLLNLIGNSFKFTPRGGSITVRFEQKDNYVYIQVTDTGAGIAKDQQDKLFQKFSMIDSSYKVNKTDVQGTGLGLFICKSIIALHEGTISAFSAGAGQGSTFTFSLKVYSDAEYDSFRKAFDGKKGLEVIHSSI